MCLPSKRSALTVFFSHLSPSPHPLSSPDQTGLAEAADQELDNWLPAQPPHPANPVHSGNQPAGSAPPSGHHHLHPDPLPGPCAVSACPGATAGHTHTHHLLPLLKTWPTSHLSSNLVPLPNPRPSFSVTHVTRPHANYAARLTYDGKSAQALTLGRPLGLRAVPIIKAKIPRHAFFLLLLSWPKEEDRPPDSDWRTEAVFIAISWVKVGLWILLCNLLENKYRQV